MRRISVIALVIFCQLAIYARSEAKITADALVEQATKRLESQVQYDGRYISIDYPMGDVPENIGVCTDVIIRSYRGLNVDLQVLVHEDMKANFNTYPSKRIWGLTKPDTNIDHRRVPNLETFFKRHGLSLALSDDPKHYLPGDIVSWRLPGNLPHIGIVSNIKAAKSERFMIIHNIGRGPELEDMLFDFPLTGHFRYWPNLLEQ